MRKQLNDDLFEVLLNHAAQNYCEQELDTLMERYGGDDRQEKHSETYRKMMRKLFDRERRKEQYLRLSNRFKPLQRVAVITLVCIVGIGTVGLSVEAFRVKLWNLFRSTNPDYTAVISVENLNFDKTNIPEGWTHVYLPENLPQDFYILKVDSSKHALVVTYADDKGDLIRLNQQTTTGKGYAWDTQNSEIQEIELGGQTYYVIEKGGQTNVDWNANNLFFSITSDLDFESLKPVIISFKKIIK